jgi:quercetin dioxygenase-like cupin family protein
MACAAGLVGFSAGVTTAQQQRAAPTDTQGARIEAVTGLDLTGAIEGVDGRQLRIRRITVEPGGHLAVHEHVGRPGSVYVLEGTLTEHRDGSEPRDYRAGQGFTEPVHIRHWAENRGTVPVVFIAVDIFKQ